jgi:Na+(H+)/acetate symporter ActP
VGLGGWPQALAVAGVCLATLTLGLLGLRLSRTTSDFYVASRAVSPLWNASAICGEYLSAASFLGVAGLVLAAGTDMLWYPVGYTAGYLALLVLVSAPLRRTGAYTLPDFAEIRMRSRVLRRAASLLVVGIGWLYLVPQFQGAGLTLQTVTGAPRWVGVATAAAVVLVGALGGGMRSITVVQAFQFWLKLAAISFPVMFLLMAWYVDGAPDPSAATGRPVARETLTAHLGEATRLRVADPTTVTVRGHVDGEPVDGTVHLAPPGGVVLGAGSTVTVPAGQPVPNAETIIPKGGASWSAPLSAGRRDHPLYRTYSLVLALLLGTMGLPHVMVRFYTNPDGRAARRTAGVVVALLGAFYLFPPIYGALARIYLPDLLLTGQTDTAVLLLPARMLPGALGETMSALVAAGAFAAFLSTSSGLVVSVAGVLGQDLLRGRASVPGFQAGAVMAVALPAAVSLLAGHVGLADTVGLAFALAASTFCPLLVLGIWWRKLTVAGALAGLAAGGMLAGSATIVTMLGGPPDGLAGALLAQPAAWTVPVAFVVMVAVSLFTPSTTPPGVRRVMVRLHAPDRLDLDRRPDVPARLATPLR